MIEKISGIGGIHPSEKVENKKEQRKEEGRDAVHISEEARVLAQIQTALKSEKVRAELTKPLIRQEKIEAVKQKLAVGAYKEKEEEIVNHLFLSLLA